MDLDAISNQELIQALTSRGVNVGGINSTTRTLYIKKLKNLLEAENGNGVVHLNGAGDDNDTNGYHEDEILDTQEEPIVQKIYPSLTETVKRRGRKEPTPAPVDGSEESDYGEESSRILSDEEMRMIREESYARRSPTRQNKPTALSALMKIIGIVIIVVFLYFLVDNATKNGNRDAL